MLLLKEVFIHPTVLGSEMLLILAKIDYFTGENISLLAPHTGHVQSSGISSKAVPGAIPPSGSPTLGS